MLGEGLKKFEHDAAHAIEDMEHQLEDQLANMEHELESELVSNEAAIHKQLAEAHWSNRAVSAESDGQLIERRFALNTAS